MGFICAAASSAGWNADGQEEELALLKHIPCKLEDSEDDALLQIVYHNSGPETQSEATSCGLEYKIGPYDAEEKARMKEMEVLFVAGGKIHRLEPNIYSRSISPLRSRRVAVGREELYNLLPESTKRICLEASGEVWLWDHSSGEPKKVLLELPSRVVQVATGGMHSLMVCKDGSCHAVAHSGTLSESVGVGSVGHLQSSRVPLPSLVVQVAAGRSHSVFLLDNGAVYSSGSNAFGQLGHGPMQGMTDASVNDQMVCVEPAQMMLDENIVVLEVTAGGDQTGLIVGHCPTGLVRGGANASACSVS